MQLQPELAEAYYHHALALHAQGQRDAAIAQLQQALACNPNSPAAIDTLERFLEGQEQSAQDRPPAQLVLYAQAHYNLGVVRSLQGRVDEAISHYQQALGLNPDSVETYNNLANLFHQRGQFKEAVACYHEALRRHPDCVEAHTNLGSALTRLGRLEEAVTSFRQALRFRPNFPEAYSNLGEAFKELGHMDQALASFEQALQLRPNFAEPRWNRALLWLLHGDFVHGWHEYEWRWSQPGVPRRAFRQPLWDGMPLNGKTILLHAEQGLGDTLHFIRYVPLVKERGGNVMVECQQPLLPLLDDFPGITSLVGRGCPPPECDVQAPLLSLPRIFGTSPTTMPSAVPYLHADPGLTEKWRQELCGVRSAVCGVELAHIAPRTPHSARGLRVGIAWQGSPTYRYDRQRSIPLAQFARLAKVPGVQLISLQKGPGTDQLAAWPGQNAPANLGNCLDVNRGAFMDTAAVVKNLDLVICSDTAIPHLAGALAVPVWLALPLVPDWRWLLSREDSPWYPTMRLFRQTRCEHWDDVFDRMAAELSKATEQTQILHG